MTPDQSLFPVKSAGDSGVPGISSFENIHIYLFAEEGRKLTDSKNRKNQDTLHSNMPSAVPQLAKPAIKMFLNL